MTDPSRGAPLDTDTPSSSPRAATEPTRDATERALCAGKTLGFRFGAFEHGDGGFFEAEAFVDIEDAIHFFFGFFFSPNKTWQYHQNLLCEEVG